ncbi:MAG: tetratricopeptide repeat protein [Candidatus Riflebacteria bacterium]|nr:tetratricopeptide repeat protein [Candidatus Riflebacteria bacterium]
MLGVDLAFDDGKPQAALALLERLRTLRPRDPTVLNNIGYAYVELGDIQKAIEAYRKATQLDPTYAQGAYNFALSLLDAGLPDQAEAALKPWVDRIKEYPVMGLLLAEACQSSGHTTDAVGYARRALAAPKIPPLVLFELGVLIRRLGDVTKAEEVFRLVMIREPAMIGAAFSLAGILREARRFDEAQKVLDDVERRAPDHPSLLTERGLLQEATGRLEAAVQSFDRAVEKDPRLSRASIWAAECLIKLRRLSEALRRLEMVLGPSSRASPTERRAAQKLKTAIERAMSGPGK